MIIKKSLNLLKIQEGGRCSTAEQLAIPRDTGKLNQESTFLINKILTTRYTLVDH